MANTNQKNSTTKSTVAGKKGGFSLSPLQNKLIVGAIVVLVAGGGYLGWSWHQNNQAQAASCINKIYKRGSSGVCVKYIQTILNHGSDKKLSVDGVFGKTTADTVKRYQKTFGHTADGVVGKATWAELCHYGTGGRGLWSVPGGVYNAAKSAGCKTTR